MDTIEIDFDVFKELTIRRTSIDVTPNDVLRSVFGLPAAKDIPKSVVRPAWTVKGIRFPEGTEFRAGYKGKEFTAKVEGSAMVFGGKAYKSPSPAAIAITGNSVNGWKFWECRRPGEKLWRSMFSIWEDEQRTK